MNGLYISRVKIKNYRNFKNVDVKLSHKQIIIGENNVGKTNFLKALQLIFDQGFSDEERMLQESDFNDSLNDPMSNNEEIRIDAYISDFQDNKNILAVLSDATYVENGIEYLLVTYRFYNHKDARGNESYTYNIFMGNDESKKFGSYERKFLNLKVIKALRDVENEMKNSRNSLIKKILSDYSISQDDFKYISDAYKSVGDKVLDLEEIKNLLRNVNSRFKKTMGTDNFNLSLRAIDIDPNKVLSSLKILMADRMPGDNSLGLNNILYITLMIYILRDKTIPSYILASDFDNLVLSDKDGILNAIYKKTPKGNYELIDSLDELQEKQLYSFMSSTSFSNDGVSILAIEEPEAHLHPINQRLIYRDVINNNKSSVILTTHSTHITAVAPLKSIVNLYIKNGVTEIHSSAFISGKEKDYLDLKRYLDVKRGEIYLSKGVILVEGISEEYMVPKMAELLGYNLDANGVVLCNINSTNFLPFVNVLNALCIPFAVITDGDHYCERNGDRLYHIDFDEKIEKNWYYGLERVYDICSKLKLKYSMADDYQKSIIELNNYGFFVGKETFEVDIMSVSQKNNEASLAIINTFNNLTTGGDLKKKNFKDNLDKGNHWMCLNRIEDADIGKGRFAQNLSSALTIDNIPDYVKNAIEYICRKVK